MTTMMQHATCVLLGVFVHVMCVYMHTHINVCNHVLCETKFTRAHTTQVCNYVTCHKQFSKFVLVRTRLCVCRASMRNYLV